MLCSGPVAAFNPRQPEVEGREGRGFSKSCNKALQNRWTWSLVNSRSKWAQELLLVWPGPPTPVFRPRRVRTQTPFVLLQLCNRRPLSMRGMQSHSTQVGNQSCHSWESRSCPRNPHVERTAAPGLRSRRRYTAGWWCRAFHRLDRTRKKKNMSIRNKDEAT